MASAYTSPNASQVLTMSPGGTDLRWLGQLGHVTDMTYSFTCPGGPDQFSCTLEVPASYRDTELNVGRILMVFRGGHPVWFGEADEPVPSTAGWAITAVGAGDLGTNFDYVYGAAGSTDDPTTWLQPDNGINQAIARGMPWANPGLDSGPYASQYWFGQQVDSGDQTVTDFMNLLCTRGGLLWYVNCQPGGLPGNDLQVFPLPTTPNRLLVCTQPVPRTLGGDVNTIWIRYMVSADNTTTGAAAVYALTSVTNAQSKLVHNALEAYIDLSDTTNPMTATSAQAVGNSVLASFVRASFSGSFQVQPGQLLTMGGQPIDPGTDQAGTVCQLILTDYGYGGEVSPQFPVSFIVGNYAWDDQNQIATITALAALDTSVANMLSMEATILTPITTASS